MRPDGALELSFAQERLWFLDQLEPESSSYNVSSAVCLAGELDVGALQRSLNIVVGRHEALRTTFPSRDGKPTSVIAPERALEMALTDVTSVDQARELAVAEARRPFDLARGPLVSARLLRLGPREHWLLISMHHIVSDSWSIGVLMEEVATLYRGGEVAPLELQYRDFAAWQRGWLSGAVLDEQLRYWKTQLAGMPDLLDLPTDRPRPPTRTSRGATRSFQLPAAMVSALQALSREQSVTLFVTLLAAFQTLLQRHARMDDIAVGTPVAGRGRAGTQPLIGLFVNALVLRTDLSGNPTFRELLGRVRDVVLGAHAHQDVPFEKLVEELRLERNLSYSPLYQVMFVLQDAPTTPALPGIEQRLLELDHGIASHDLTLELRHAGEGLVGSFEYNSDLFDASRIERMIGHYQTLLETIVTHADRRLGELPILTERERQQILIDWNDTARDYGTDRCIHELFEAHVDRAPDSVAVELATARLTYRELDARANQLAHHLRRFGVGPEMRVGICVERSIEMLVGILGILKAGGAYLPMDPTYPKDRIAFMLGDANITVLVTQARLVEKLPPHDTRVVRLDADAPQIAAEPTDRAPRSATARNLACVIYTSGSTGRPKGIQIEHRGICNLALGYGELGELSPSDRVLQWSSFAFVAFVDEMWPTLAYGGTVLFRGDEVPAPGELFDRPHMRGVTALTLTTAYWHDLVAALERGDASLPSSLRRVNVGGERALPEWVRAWAAVAPECVLFNIYGATETTALSTVWRQRPDEPLLAGHEVPIGRPLPNYKAYVVDSHLGPVPIGVPGELCIGGVGVARGYLNLPELTAEKFVANPFGPGRLYRTGDLVCWLPNGDLECLGRLDYQVKIRGFRIELGEIETALTEHPSVRSAVVLAREDTPGDRRLVAYIVGTEPSPDLRALRAYIKGRLPEFMVPSAFVVLDAMPMSPNLKVDRKQLPAPDGREALATQYVAPRNTVEEHLASAFADVLRIERVGSQHDFFELGGNSLLAVQLRSAIQARLGVALPVATLFRAPTVEALAREIDVVAAKLSSLVVLRRHGSRDPLVCVHPLSGTVFCYQALITRLANDRPCYGLEANGIENDEVLADTFEAIARDYARALIEQRGSGRFHLMGWSLGGLLALELARRLVAEGREVGSIILVDSYLPSTYATPEGDFARSVHVFAYQLQIDARADELRALGSEAAALARVLELGHRGGRIPVHLGIDHLARRYRVYSTLDRAATRYALPTTVPGRAVFVRVAEGIEENGRILYSSDEWPAQLWQTFDVRILPGSHGSIVEVPYVEALARVIDEVID